MQEKDEERDKYLERIGIKVIRYTNYEVMRQIDGVSDSIIWHMNNRIT